MQTTSGAAETGLVARRRTQRQLPALELGTRPEPWRRMFTEQSQTREMDGSLVARLAAGDERALAQLYDRLGATAYSMALSILGDAADAEETVADAFAQVWRSAAKFDMERGSVSAWVFTITRTRALDRLRAHRRRSRLLEIAATEADDGQVLAPEPLPAADRELEREEIGARVRESLAALPEPQRKVIELAYFGGLSQSEIAERLREPLGTVKTRTRSAMEKLRAALSPLRPEMGP